MATSDGSPEKPHKPLKDIIGKKYVFPFGEYKDRKLWQIMDGDPSLNFPANPQWLLDNDGVCFNLSQRLRDEVETKVAKLRQGVSK